MMRVNALTANSDTCFGGIPFIFYVSILIYT